MSEINAYNVYSYIEDKSDEIIENIQKGINDQLERGAKYFIFNLDQKPILDDLLILEKEIVEQQYYYLMSVENHYSRKKVLSTLTARGYEIQSSSYGYRYSILINESGVENSKTYDLPMLKNNMRFSLPLTDKLCLALTCGNTLYCFFNSLTLIPAIIYIVNILYFMYKSFNHTPALYSDDYVSRIIKRLKKVDYKISAQYFIDNQID